jgi:ADP-ribose pyrophosphatase YjhB (NUDIX family)
MSTTFDDRSYPKRPIVGVGGLILDGQSIVLVQRGKEPLLGYWTIPGGAVEAGESLDLALRREVAEETGLIVEPGPLVTIFERITPDDAGRTKYHYVLADYLCFVTGGELRAGSDVTDARWVRRSDLPQVQLTSGTLAVIEKAFDGQMVV